MQFHDMGKDKSSLLTRLKRAVKKVRFLLDYSMNRWHLASVLRRASSSKRISFNDRLGLRAAWDDGTIYSDESGGSSSRSGIQRTMSFPSDEDVDKRADMFIANFYRQLRLERQISLELQYCRGNSFKSISPWLIIFWVILSFFFFFFFFGLWLLFVCLIEPLIFRKGASSMNLLKCFWSCSACCKVPTAFFPSFFHDFYVMVRRASIVCKFSFFLRIM